MMKQNQRAALMRAAKAAKLAGDKYKALADEIKAEMKESNLNEMEAGGCKATIKEVNTTSIDWKKFQADHPELASEIAKYTVNTSSTRLYLK